MTILRKEIYESMFLKNIHLIQLIQNRLANCKPIFLFQKKHKKSYEID
jgi:hypothetical protein